MKKPIVMLAMLLAMIACKEDEPHTPNPTPAEMIARTWKVQSVTINGQADNTTDYSNFRFTFNSNQTYRFTMPDDRQGNWELISNATALALDQGTTQEQRVAIQKLTETEMDLEFTEQSDKTGTRHILFELVP